MRTNMGVRARQPIASMHGVRFVGARRCDSRARSKAMHAHGARGSIVAVVAALLVTASAVASGQTTPTFSGPACTAPPAPQNDGWPVAATGTIGSTMSVKPLTFTAASLLANDTGTGLKLNAIAATTVNGGTVSGTDPFTYVARATFSGTDVFTYQIVDSYGQTTTGLAKVTVARDRTAPTVSITAPAAGTVSGVVAIVAAAADDIGVVSVAFFDGTTVIGSAVTAPPFQTTWDTTAAAAGVHTLTAIARDAA